MRYLIAFFLSLSLFASEPWTTTDYALESATIVSLACDFGQTSAIHTGRWHEINSILGRHPEQSTITNYFTVAGLVHIVVADQLHGNYRTAWQMIWLSTEVGTVQRNYKLGIRFNF